VLRLRCATLSTNGHFPDHRLAIFRTSALSCPSQPNNATRSRNSLRSFRATHFLRHLADFAQRIHAIDAAEYDSEMSPTVFREGGFRFYFFSREESRMHVHVTG